MNDWIWGSLICFETYQTGPGGFYDLFLERKLKLNIWVGVKVGALLYLNELEGARVLACLDMSWPIPRPCRDFFGCSCLGPVRSLNMLSLQILQTNLYCFSEPSPASAACAGSYVKTLWPHQIGDFSVVSLPPRSRCLDQKWTSPTWPKIEGLWTWDMTCKSWEEKLAK